jgi:hypothetical protein
VAGFAEEESTEEMEGVKVSRGITGLEEIMG